MSLVVGGRSATPLRWTSAHAVGGQYLEAMSVVLHHCLASLFVGNAKMVMLFHSYCFIHIHLYADLINIFINYNEDLFNQASFQHLNTAVWHYVTPWL